jgi:hypothetical protein
MLLKHVAALTASLLSSLKVPATRKRRRIYLISEKVAQERRKGFIYIYITEGGTGEEERALRTEDLPCFAWNTSSLVCVCVCVCCVCVCV